MSASPIFAPIFYVSLVALLPFNAFSQDAASTRGFSGIVSIHAGVSQSQSQHNTHDDNSVTKNLSNKGKQVNQIVPMILGRLQYSFGDTLIFLGNSEEQIAEANFQAELGLSHELANDVAFTVALFGSVPNLNEVWRDPYLTDIARSTTDQSISGMRLAFDFYSPIPFSIKYAFAQSDVDKDEIGLSQKLNETQRSLLYRDSDYHRFGSEVLFNIGPYLSIAPGFYYSFRDADGKAKTFHELSGQVSFAVSTSKHTFTTTLRNSIAEFDTANPLFNKKQDYQSLGLFSLYSYQEIFNLSNTNLNVMMGYQTTNSDIEFYSSKNLFISTGVSYKF